MPIIECGIPRLYDEQLPADFEQRVLMEKGPTVFVEVGFEPSIPDSNFLAAHQAALAQSQPGATPTGQMRVVLALIDTGATNSCIDDELAVDLGLPAIDKGTNLGVGGAHELILYLGHIKIPKLGFIQYGKFSGAKLQGQPYRALLGRDMLKDMMLVYDGRTGHCRLAF